MALPCSRGEYKGREIALIIVAIAAVALCVLFLGLYAAKTPSGSVANQGVTAQQQGNSPTTTSKPKCNTPTCLETTAYVWSLVNSSVDPCEDFYTYACGNWEKRNPMDPFAYYWNVIHKLYRQNEERIRNLIESPKLRDVPWGSERKVKDLYTSCLNDFTRMKAGANPFINKVLTPVGGWYVLGNFQPTTWDLLDHIEKVHVDHWTDVLFAVEVWSDWYDNFNTRMIVVRNARLGMSQWYYRNNSGTNKTRVAYMDYMRTVVGMLIRDSGVQMSDEVKANRTDVFISDVMNIESMLANISYNSRFDYRSYSPEKRVKIKDLAGITNTTFNWISFFSYMFDKTLVTPNTYIAVPERDYLGKMALAINNMADNKNRILNNYFTWSLVRKYIQEMSAEYIHAFQTFSNTQYSTTEFIPTWERCFRFVRSKMRDAISHLFVTAHFGEKNKDKVHEIADYVKDALTDTFVNDNFMDAATQTKAKAKVKATLENIGYPDYVIDQDSVDFIYASLEVHDTDYFQNVLNMNKFYREDLNNQLKARRSDPEEWHYSSAEQAAHYYDYQYNRIVVTAGLLQHPIYDYRLPHYLNFGSMGTILAKDYLQGIDYYGSRYNKKGKRIEGSTRSPGNDYVGWWTDPTLNKYTKLRDCVAEVADNKTDDSSDPFHSFFPSRFRGNSIVEEMWRIKAALKAYKAWITRNGAEPPPPSIGLTNQQMYFVAYAQAQCYVETDFFWPYFYFADSNHFTMNIALSQVKEFSDAFKCSATASLNPANKCT